MRIGAAFPNPPFELERDDVDTGFDTELMRAVCGHVGLRWKLVKYDGADFNGIFAGLRTGDYDAVVSGTAITPEREKVALFSEPYLEAPHGVVVNTTRTPHLSSVDDLVEQIVGIQNGGSSDDVGRQLEAAGTVGDLRAYPYGALVRMVDDLDAGRIGAFVTLVPTARWLVKERPVLGIAAQLSPPARLAIAVAPGSVVLRDAVNQALAEGRRSGLLERLERRWLT